MQTWCDMIVVYNSVNTQEQNVLPVLPSSYLHIERPELCHILFQMFYKIGSDCK